MVRGTVGSIFFVVAIKPKSVPQSSKYPAMASLRYPHPIVETLWLPIQHTNVTESIG